MAKFVEIETFNGIPLNQVMDGMPVISQTDRQIATGTVTYDLPPMCITEMDDVFALNPNRICPILGDTVRLDTESVCAMPCLNKEPLFTFVPGRFSLPLGRGLNLIDFADSGPNIFKH